MTKKRIHLVYGIILSIVTVIAGICLIAACIGIYNSGDRPYSPDAVKAAFSSIAIPVYSCLVLIIGGFILDGFFPISADKVRVDLQYDALLTKRYLTVEPELRNNPYRRKRRLHRCISLVLLALGSVIFLCYGMNSANFTDDINSSMIKAMYVLLPCMAIPFCYSVFSEYYAKHSKKEELAFLKSKATNTQSPVVQARPRGSALVVARWVLLAVGVFLLVFGFVAGGTSDVLTKAVNLCTECIGLG